MPATQALAEAIATLPMADQRYCRTIANPGAALRSAVARQAAQQAADRLGMAYHGIGHQTHGRPALLTGQPLGGTAHAAYISLSHAPALAGALICLGVPCGLDIEPVRAKIIAIAPRFLSQTELTYLPDAADAQMLTKFWSAKEAAYKMLGLRGLSIRDHLLARYIDEGIFSVGCIYPGHAAQIMVTQHIKSEQVVSSCSG